MPGHTALGDGLGDCTCCGSEICYCTCCYPYLGGDGYYRHMQIKFGVVFDIGTPTPSAASYSGTTIDLYKVNGECKWESADRLFRVIHDPSAIGPAASYEIRVYSSASDADNAHHSFQSIESPGFGADDTWCRDNGNTNPSADAGSIGAMGAYGAATDYWFGTVDYYQPVSDDGWVACSDTYPNSPECELDP